MRFDTLLQCAQFIQVVVGRAQCVVAQDRQETGFLNVQVEHNGQRGHWPLIRKGYFA